MGWSAGDPVVCMLASRAAVWRRGSDLITEGLFHVIYVAQEKWFHGPAILFHLRCDDETIGGARLCG